MRQHGVAQAEVQAAVREKDASIFYAMLRGLKEPAACAALFREAIAPFGFDTFACGDVDPADRDRNVFHLIDWPDAWKRFYIRSGLIERDPVVDAVAERREAFTWTELRADRRLAQAGREALDLAAEAGWTEGLVAPMPGGSARFGLVSLAGHTSVTRPEVRAHLGLLAACLYGHVRTLTAEKGFAQPPMGLTDREIACLRLVVRGRSDAQIAVELGVAPATAHEFAEKAQRRMRFARAPRWRRWPSPTASSPCEDSCLGPSDQRVLALRVRRHDRVHTRGRDRHANLCADHARHV